MAWLRWYFANFLMHLLTLRPNVTATPDHVSVAQWRLCESRFTRPDMSSHFVYHLKQCKKAVPKRKRKSAAILQRHVRWCKWKRYPLWSQFILLKTKWQSIIFPFSCSTLASPRVTSTRAYVRPIYNPAGVTRQNTKTAWLIIIAQN